MTVSLACFDFAPAHGADLAAGGTAVEFAALRAFLAAQSPRVRARMVPICRLEGPGRTRAGAFLRRQVADLRALLSAREQVLLLVYPKVPFLGQFSLATAPLAAAGYPLLAAQARRRGQRVIVLLTDLPLEQGALTGPLGSPADLQPALAGFLARRRSAADRAREALEGQLLRSAHAVIALSPLMAAHLVRKHGLAPARILLRGRNLFAPAPAPARIPEVGPGAGPRVLYSGDLVRPTTRRRLAGLLPAFGTAPGAALHVCGRDGDWLAAEASRRGLGNVRYHGALDRGAHDALARQCDLGLVVYDLAYAHLVTTAKYSAYVGSGLAVLSTELATLEACLAEDGVGESVPADRLADRLGAWLREPARWTGYRDRARTLAPRFTSGDFMQAWLEPVLREVEAG